MQKSFKKDTYKAKKDSADMHHCEKSAKHRKCKHVAKEITYLRNEGDTRGKKVCQ